MLMRVSGLRTRNSCQLKGLVTFLVRSQVAMSCSRAGEEPLSGGYIENFCFRFDAGSGYQCSESGNKRQFNR